MQGRIQDLKKGGGGGTAASIESCASPKKAD